MGCLKLSHTEENTLLKVSHRSDGVGLKGSAGPNRHGYQGEFSEMDTTTGWNAFELRMYDPLIGRWLQVDPAGQFASPYNGMGNNPVNGVDPDGAWVKGAGFFRNLFNSDAKIHAQNIAASSNAGDFGKEIFANKQGGNWGVTISDREFYASSPDANYASKWTSFTIVNSDGSLGATDGAYSFVGLGRFSDHPGLTSVFDVAGTLAYSSLAFEAGLAGVSYAGLRGIAMFGNFATQSGRALFWGGGGLTPAAASSFAGLRGLTSLAETAGGSLLNSRLASFGFGLIPRFAHRGIWNSASANFARGASGSVHLLGTGGRTWFQIEKPIIMRKSLEVITHVH